MFTGFFWFKLKGQAFYLGPIRQRMASHYARATISLGLKAQVVPIRDVHFLQTGDKGPIPDLHTREPVKSVF